MYQVPASEGSSRIPEKSNIEHFKEGWRAGWAHKGKVALFAIAAHAIYRRSALLSGIESIANAAIAKSPALATAAAKYSPAWVAFKAFVIANPAVLVVGLVVVGGVVCLYIRHRSKVAKKAAEEANAEEEKLKSATSVLNEQRANLSDIKNKNITQAHALDNSWKELRKNIDIVEGYCKTAANSTELSPTIKISIREAKIAVNEAVKTFAKEFSGMYGSSSCSSSQGPTVIAVPYPDVN